MKWAFFGTPELSVLALEEMASLNCRPDIVVCNPDTPVGRKQLITPPPTKVWAETNGIAVFQPASLKHETELTPLTKEDWDFFVVFAYGKIMPEWLINLPKYGTINAHPSLLPKLRGASPIRSTLLHDLSAAGVTIIEMDAELDHGPILTQLPVTLETPIPGRDLDTMLARICGDLLVHVMQEIMAKKITPRAQPHEDATFCTKITKDMAELAIDPHQLPTGDEALTVYKKICAFDGWPEAFFIHQNQRVKIKRATLTPTGTLEITHVTPEGKSEIAFTQYLSVLAAREV